MSKRILTLAIFLIPFVVNATHLRGGQVRVVSSDGLTCLIEVRVLTNTDSDIKFGDGIVDFGDGTQVTSPTIDNTKVPGQPNLGTVTWTIQHTYAAPGIYIVTYTEPNLVGGILNMVNSVETKFRLESEIVIDPSLGSYVSPNFPTDPILFVPAGNTFSSSTAAINDSTSNDFWYRYSIVTDPVGISNFQVPGDLSVNEYNGLITWDTRFEDMYIMGEFWIEVKVEKYSKSGQYYGYVIRAVTLNVEDGSTKVGVLSSTPDPDKKIVVTEGEEETIKAILFDNYEGTTFDFDIYYSGKIHENISIDTYDSTSGDLRFKVVLMSLKTTPDIVSDLPYPITLHGHSGYYFTDITFLLMTKDVPLPKAPPPPTVVTGLEGVIDTKVYPNPFHSELFVDGAGSTHATFINSMGQIVMRSHIVHGQPLNTTTLPAGLYLLQVTNEGGRKSILKVVRSH